jgi:hypothetical protein
VVRAGCHNNGGPAILLLAHVGTCQGQARRTAGQLHQPGLFPLGYDVCLRVFLDLGYYPTGM